MRVLKTPAALLAGVIIGACLFVATPAGATTKAKAPGSLTAVSVVEANTAFSVSWTIPASPGTSPISGYTATATSTGLTTESCTTTGATACVITGIVNPAGKTKNKYKISVTATSAVGTGKAGKAPGTSVGTTTANCSYVGEYANLRGCALPSAFLEYADLSGANLSGANLAGADLAGADLSYVDLTYADLSGANLAGANLRGANLSFTSLIGTNLLGVNPPDITWFDTICPDGTNSNNDGDTCIGP